MRFFNVKIFLRTFMGEKVIFFPPKLGLFLFFQEENQLPTLLAFLLIMLELKTYLLTSWTNTKKTFINVQKVKKTNTFKKFIFFLEEKRVADVKKEFNPKKVYEDIVLLEQDLIDGGKKVKQLVEETGAKLGSPITVKNFVKFVRGEGIQRQVVDIAKEVEQVLGKK